MPGPEARKKISKIGFCLLVFVFFFVLELVSFNYLFV